MVCIPNGFFLSEFLDFSPHAAVYGHNRKPVPDFRKFLAIYPLAKFSEIVKEDRGNREKF